VGKGLKLALQEHLYTQTNIAEKIPGLQFEEQEQGKLVGASKSAYAIEEVLMEDRDGDLLPLYFLPKGYLSQGIHHPQYVYIMGATSYAGLTAGT
jgi:hypothetical protein